MTRTIKASEVQPGMTIRWEGRGFIHEGLVERTTAGVYPRATRVLSGQFGMDIPEDAEVTVLTEAQPEEPTAFGARVVAGRERFLRCDCDSRPWRSVSEDGALGFFADWPLVCEAGPVIVIDADPSWTLPAQVKVGLVVPERIEEWDTWEDVPEGVVVTVPGLFCHYRKNQGVVEFSDPDDDPDWTEPGVRTMPRDYGPWTRVSDA